MPDAPVPGVPKVEILGVPGIPEIRSGDDLAGLLASALAGAGTTLHDGDVLIVSSKIVSKAEGRAVAAAARTEAVDGQTRRVVAERVGPRGATRVVESTSGPVLAAAGVDASNVPPGTVLLLPEAPDDSARRLRARLRGLTGALVGVVVSDTAGRAWRDGQVDLAIGAAGVRVTDDLRGGTDTFGTSLEVTVRALADELASAGDLVKGKITGTPVAVVRGLPGLVTADDGPGAAALLRPGDTDWFALGHVEAVRSALGAPPGTDGVPPQPLLAGDAAERLGRAIRVATCGRSRIGRLPALSVEWIVPAADAPATEAPATDTAAVRVAPSDPAVLTGVEAMALGALAQRVLAAAWAEGLTATCQTDDDTGGLVVQARVGGVWELVRSVLPRLR